MKKPFLILFILLLSILSCKKKSVEEEKQIGISYPNSIFYGNNVLSFPDSTLLQYDEDYSMGAVLEKDANLKILMTNLSESDSVGHTAVWFYGETIG